MTKSANIDQQLRKEMNQVFDQQSTFQYEVANTTVKERKAKLTRLLKAVLARREDIKAALSKDMRKHESEVDLTEVFPIVKEIKYARKNLHRWMRKEEVSTPLALFGSSSHIHYEPKGVVLIISPWNFPFNLSFAPLISAIAAGNTVIIKPSEMTVHSSRLIKEIIESVFDKKEVAVFEGGIPASTHLLSLPFNHIFFTGSPKVGKIVMEAAAKHLASVTLELGGKSPTIIDKGMNLDVAARRIAWGKFINNGQICIAPDYVYVHRSQVQEFVDKMKGYLTKYYGQDASQNSSYGRIVNDRHTERVSSYLKDAVHQGAEVIGGNIDENHNYISPTLVTQSGDDTEIMQNEIFGPLLPIKTYENLEDVVNFINKREKPLALYIYSNNRKNVRYVINNTRAGGTCINHNAIHFFNPNLPFGGSNNSGIGKSHGYFGFKEFSNARAVLKQHIPNALELLVPPYNGFKKKLIDFTIKYL